MLFVHVHLYPWSDIIVNYSRIDYNAGSQNWMIIQLPNHWLYVANKTGILEFNGNDWTQYRLNNRSELRSLYYSANSGRIYVGGANEIGYLSPDKSGKLRYTCIVSDMNSDDALFGNIWQIHEVDNVVYFCADASVIRLYNDKITYIPSPDKIDCSEVFQNAVYIGTVSGIYVLAGESFLYLPKCYVLKNKKIRNMCLWKDELLVATSLDGLFVMKKDSVVPVKTKADSFIRKNELFSMAVSDSKIAVGTILDGLVLLDFNGEILDFVNNEKGLQNNTILSLYFDNENNLWMGLDNGLSKINLNSPLRNLYLPPDFYGAGYTAAFFNDKLYLGTNQGLYFVEWPVPVSETPVKPQLIKGMQGQIWNISSVNDKLICCTDRGLFILDDDNSITKTKIDIGTWKLEPFREKNKSWISTYNGFYMLDDYLGDMKLKYLENYNNTIINFEFIEPHILFIENYQREIIKLEIDNDFSHVTKRTIFPSPSFPGNFHLFKYNDTMKLSGENGFFVFDDSSLVVDNTFNKAFSFDEGSTYKRIKEKGKMTWALGENSVEAISKIDNKRYRVSHNIPLINYFENILPVGDSMLIICNENGYALWNINSISEQQKNNLQMINIATVKPVDSLVFVSSFAGRDTLLEIPYKNNSLRFYFKLYGSGNNKYNTQYRVKIDDDEWFSYSFADTKVFSDINPGNHTFAVEAKAYSGEICHMEFDFKVLAPWYQTNIAYVFYLLCIILLFYLVRIGYKKRLQKESEQLKQRQQKEIEQKEEEYRMGTEIKEREIIRLQNEQLEMEVRHKNQELANVAINMSRKNETLIEIKEELKSLSRLIGRNETDNATIKRNIITISNRIDENITLDNSFDRFEEHFDLVHNNFIRSLTEQYPALTINERKMCAFIKMQFVSKEIAPLLNISVRGVETLRYRLRKKFNLDHEESLTAFLNNFDSKKV
jgi:DNA-binding CsgD family transcriptional regulator